MALAAIGVPADAPGGRFILVLDGQIGLLQAVYRALQGALQAAYSCLQRRHRQAVALAVDMLLYAGRRLQAQRRACSPLRRFDIELIMPPTRLNGMIVGAKAGLGVA
jgi:hypothetical protein